MFSWLSRRKQPYGGETCRSSLAKVQRERLGFQGRAVCPKCNRAIVVNADGRFYYHKTQVAGLDYLNAKRKGF